MSPGQHTQDYLYGHRNGTSSFQWNKGFSEGYSRVPLSSHTSDYLDGYKFGVRDRTVYLEPSVPSQLPAHTKDNYTHYYIGIHDGGVAADNDNANGSVGYHGCPAGHTQEYCVGYEQGYNYEFAALIDW
jgi:hypothetical protein